MEPSPSPATVGGPSASCRRSTIRGPDAWTWGSADGLFVDSAIEAMAESLWRTEDRSTDGGERRSRSQRRADALVELIRRGCAKQRAGASAVVPTLHLILDAGDLEAGRGADTPGGHHIGPAGTDRLTCDGAAVEVVRYRHTGAALDRAAAVDSSLAPSVLLSPCGTRDAASRVVAPHHRSAMPTTCDRGGTVAPATCRT